MADTTDKKEPVADFALATRKSYRFSSTRGELSTEDLWHLTKQELDGIYKRLMAALEKFKSSSLLDEDDVESAKEKSLLQKKIEIIKYIVQYKKDAETRMAKSRDRAKMRNLVSGLLAEKQMDAIKAKSAEELQKMLDDEAATDQNDDDN